MGATKASRPNPAGRLPLHIARLGWDAEQLAAYQREQLQALLATAARHSSFHARRLAGIDPGRFKPGQLARLPVMTRTCTPRSTDAPMRYSGTEQSPSTR
jgi:hypothetical protein